jgi:hypothetical protein
MNLIGDQVIRSKVARRPDSIAVKILSRRFFFVAAAILLLSVPAAWLLAARPAASQESRFPKASEIVKPQVSLQPDSVGRGRSFSVTVNAEIRPGFHIQANKVLEDYLIPTTLEAQIPDGLMLVDTSYPKARLVKFPFNPKEMAVYEGRIVLKMKIAAAASAPLGKLKLPLTLHYQACSDAACLPPVKLPLEATVEIVAAR